MGDPSSARRPPEVLRMRNSLRPSSAGRQPMPTSWLQPNRSPLGALRSRSSVSGRLPAGPATVEWMSHRAGSVSTREASVEVASVMRVPGTWDGGNQSGPGSGCCGLYGSRRSAPTPPQTPPAASIMRTWAPGPREEGGAFPCLARGALMTTVPGSTGRSRAVTLVGIVNMVLGGVGVLLGIGIAGLFVVRFAWELGRGTPLPPPSRLLESLSLVGILEMVFAVYGTLRLLAGYDFWRRKRRGRI